MKTLIVHIVLVAIVGVDSGLLSTLSIVGVWKVELLSTPRRDARAGPVGHHHFLDLPLRCFSILCLFNPHATLWQADQKCATMKPTDVDSEGSLSISEFSNIISFITKLHLPRLQDWTGIGMPQNTNSSSLQS